MQKNIYKNNRTHSAFPTIEIENSFQNKIYTLFSKQHFREEFLDILPDYLCAKLIKAVLPNLHIDCTYDNNSLMPNYNGLREGLQILYQCLKNDNFVRLFAKRFPVDMGHKLLEDAQNDETWIPSYIKEKMVIFSDFIGNSNPIKKENAIPYNVIVKLVDPLNSATVVNTALGEITSMEDGYIVIKAKIDGIKSRKYN